MNLFDQYDALEFLHNEGAFLFDLTEVEEQYLSSVSDDFEAAPVSLTYAELGELIAL